MALAPLADITNRHVGAKQLLCDTPMSHRSDFAGISPEALSPQATSPLGASVKRHNPYNWKCLPEDENQAAMILAHRAVSVQHNLIVRPTISITIPIVAPFPGQIPTSPLVSMFMDASDKDDVTPPAPAGPTVCRALVQFKCHQTEFSSPILVEKGQYVVVQGDRGIDIGVVIRVNTESHNRTSNAPDPVVAFYVTRLSVRLITGQQI